MKKVIMAVLIAFVLSFLFGTTVLAGAPDAIEINATEGGAQFYTDSDPKPQPGLITITRPTSGGGTHTFQFSPGKPSQ
jgi:hypothetical protein